MALTGEEKKRRNAEYQRSYYRARKAADPDGWRKLNTERMRAWRASLTEEERERLRQYDRRRKGAK